MLKKTSCIAPFINLTIDPNNNASPCPYLGGGVWKFDKNLDVKKIWQSEQLERLRNSHLQGKKDPVCQRCWNDEAIGKQSQRQRFLQDFHNQLDTITSKIKNKTYKGSPTILTMKNGNICNLQCRTCGPKDSYSWVPEAKQYVQKFESKTKNTFFDQELFKKNWTDQQLDDFKNFNENLIRVEHFGGEPLHNPKVIEHTEMLVELGYAKNIVLYMNTNGTHIPNLKLQSLFKHFKHVEFNLSIDGVGDQFEYIRYPGKWTQIGQMVRWCLKQKNFSWGIVTTVSNLNIFYLKEILDTFAKWKKTNIFFNLLEAPHYYNIQNLPTKVKDIITTKYKSIPILQPVVNYMNAQEQTKSHWTNFKFWTQQKDSYRKNNFAFTFPEFCSIIEE